MSLHDIDKGGSKRSKPKPNSSDSVVDRLAHGTTQLQHSIDEAESDGLLIRERQILAVQDGFEKAVMGFYGTENKFGLKVAEDGVNVTEATDDQLIFNSEQNVFKIVLSGTITLPFAADGTTSTATVSHGLGYIPAVVAFLFNGTLYLPLPNSLIESTGANAGKVLQYVSFITDADKITFYNQSQLQGTGGPDIKYYILQETAS